MISLDEKNLIARGGARYVFLHPGNPNLCIKVDAPDSVGGEGATLSEAALFQNYLDVRGGRKFEAISNFQGLIETNRGVGGQYELILDEKDGTPSKTLMEVLSSQPHLIKTSKFKRALKSFRATLLKDAVLCKDLRPWNICVQQKMNGELRLVLVDGVDLKRSAWYSNVSLIVQAKMLYYFFKKRIYPINRLFSYTDGWSGNLYTWRSGPAYKERILD